VLIGDGQWGKVHAHDLLTRVRKWAINNPQHGVTNIAVADVDGDAVVDLLWGAGWSSSGADYLYVANTTGMRNIKWQSVDLQGPFLGPVIGDIDGDSQPELVMCSPASESRYSSGRILVFDLATLRLRALSPPIAGSAGRLINDFKLHDVDGDGVLDVVVAGASHYPSEGLIHVYGFSTANAFTLKWANSGGINNLVSHVQVADLDGNGTQEIIASSQTYLYIFDYPANTNPWRSMNLASSGSVTGLVVEDLDGIGGSREIAALVTNGDLYTFDGPTRQLRNLRQSTGATRLSSRATPWGLVAADNSGLGRFLRYGNDSFSESFARQLANGPLTGITVLSNGSLWSGSSSILSMRPLPDYSSVGWTSPSIGISFGRNVARQVRDGENAIFSSARHAVVGLLYPREQLALLSAASRKLHGADAGGQDTALALSGQPDIEPRNGGANGDHTLVFTFNNDVVNGSAAVTAGNGAISGTTFANNTMTVTLSGVTDAQRLTVRLTGVSDEFGQVLAPASITIGLLVGDVNGDGVVNSGDALITRNRSGRAAAWDTCRSDLNTDGTVNAGDVTGIRNRVGNFIP
jgi:hypothetical protein